MRTEETGTTTGHSARVKWEGRAIISANKLSNLAN